MHYSIEDYLKYYKDLSWEEEPFNDVDNLILSLISYVELDFAFEKKKILTIKEASDMYWNHFDKSTVDKNITMVKKSSYLIKKLATCKRYQNLILLNYENYVDEKMQFGAVMISLPNDMVYVSFKGTDHNIIGWKEDLQLSYLFPIPSQNRAIEYLNEHIKIQHRKIIVGGHSKGGNLALVSSMYCRPSIQRRIIKIYSNDGPGLRKEQILSKEYQNVVNRFRHIIPKNSLVGVLLSHKNDIVIDSSAKGFFQHDALTWRCYGGHFIEVDLHKAAKKRDTFTDNWLELYDDKEREKIVESVFNVFEVCNVTDLREIKNVKMDQILRKIRTLKNVDETTRNLILKTIKELMKQFINYKEKI